MRGGIEEINIRNTWDLTQPEHTLASQPIGKHSMLDLWWMDWTKTVRITCRIAAQDLVRH